jgi:hypothetical protein
MGKRKRKREKKRLKRERKRAARALRDAGRATLAEWAIRDTEQLIADAFHPLTETERKVRQWETDFFTGYLTQDRYSE